MAKSHEQDPSSKWTVIIGLLGLLILLATVIALQALFYRVQNQQIEDKVYSAIPTELAQLRDKHLIQLNSEGTPDEQNNFPRIPIEEAMEQTLQDLAEQREQAN